LVFIENLSGWRILKEISKEIYTIANITCGIIGWVGKYS
jgi:hypothetical protein